MNVGKLGFGCMRLPLTDQEDRASFDEKQVEQMVDMFIENGFTYFDTAYMYHNYQSEVMLKKALIERHSRDSFTLADKMPSMLLKKPEDQDFIFDEQLRKTGAGHFDYYLMHSITEPRIGMLEEFGTWKLLQRKKEEGFIKHLGFSFHDGAETLDRLLTMHPEVEFVQLQINYLDWNNKSVQSGRCYETARKHGKKIVVMEPVKGGTLAEIPEEAETLLRGIDPDASPASWAIRFAASLEGVMMVLSGMSTIGQMRDNISFMKKFRPLSDDEKKAVGQVREILINSNTVPCTSCRYCVEGCPEHIDIPALFELYNEEIRPTSRAAYGRESENKYARLTEGHGKASDCISCRNCVNACPQHIEVPDELKKVAEAFEN